MKLRKLLFLCPLFFMSACGTSSESISSVSSSNQSEQTTSSESESISSSSSSEEGINSKLSAAFKEAGEEIAYVAASKQRVKSLYTDMDESDKMMQLATPSGIVYVVGKLYENEGFDCSTKIVEFREVYDMDNGPGSTPLVADVTLSLMVSADVEHNKAMLYANEVIDMTQGSTMHMVTNAYMFLDFDFNFATNTLGDFKMWNKADNTYPGSSQPSNTGYNHAKRTGTEIKKLDLNTHDEDYTTVMNEIESYITFFNNKEASKTVADTTTARTYGESFIAGQTYINNIVNSTGSIDFHNK